MSSLGFSRYRPLGGMNWASVLVLRQGSDRFTGSAYKSSFDHASRTWGVGLPAYFLNLIINNNINRQNQDTKEYITIGHVIFYY